MAEITLINADGLRERFDIDGDDETAYPDNRLNPSIRAAGRRLRGWVGDTVYDAALVMVNTDPVPDDVDLEVLQNAEGHLAMHYALLGFNSPITKMGVVVTATAAEGKEVRRYLAPKETAELAQMYLDQAVRILGDLYPAGDGDTVSVIRATTAGEGATRGRCVSCGYQHAGACGSW